MNIEKNSNFLYRFREIADLYPNNIAILEDGKKITTYKELLTNAHKVAAYLTENCPSDRVGIAINKSSEYIASILGCWIAKKAFVPFDKTLPEERTKFIQENAELKTIFSIEDFQTALTFEYKEFDYNLPKDFPAYIIYTSGTTGLPKGVLVSHNGIVNLADNQRKAFQTDSNSRYLFYLSINFDASMSDISVCLLSGAALVIESSERIVIASSIVDLIKQRNITHMHHLLIQQHKVKPTRLKKI